ncbi:MAG TPA: hypothetical protein VFU03_06125 [Gemmatimonadales bacterium]|nr:hypothetical protein [Gemmatimonadales bacterium]
MLSRRAVLFLLTLVLGLSPARLRAQASGPWSGCKTDSLSNYNCAQYYSGTVSYNSELKTADGTEVRSITATVTGGKVSCKVKTPDGPAFDGPGMLVAEHASSMTSGKYSIKVWCPEAAGERPTRKDYPAIDTNEQQAADYATLEGKDAHEHPDADPANGVSGTETIAWQLKR